MKVEANGFSIRGNRVFLVLRIVNHVESLQAAQVRIERSRVARPTQFDPRRDVPEQCQLESVGNGIRNLRLQLQNVAQIPVIGL